MAVVEMGLLFSSLIPSFLERLWRIESLDDKELAKIAYEMIDVTEQFTTDFQEFSTAERIDRIERLILHIGKCYGTYHSKSRRYETTSKAVTK